MISGILDFAIVFGGFVVVLIAACMVASSIVQKKLAHSGPAALPPELPKARSAGAGR